MNQELRNRFFTTHYDEINALCHRATYRICQIYGWAMHHDIHGYVMEGIVRGIDRLQGVARWQNFLYVYGYKKGLSGALELLGLKRCRSTSKIVGIRLKYVTPYYLDQLSWTHSPRAHLYEWINTTEYRLEQECFFDQLRPSVERNVLGLLMADKTRKSIVDRAHLNDTSYWRITHNLRKMYGRVTRNRSIEHLYAKSATTRCKSLN